MGDFSLISNVTLIGLTLLAILGVVTTRANGRKFSFVVFALSISLFIGSALYNSMTGRDLLIEYVFDPLVRLAGFAPASDIAIAEPTQRLGGEPSISDTTVDFWSVVSAPLSPNSYNSDLLLTQTHLQLAFVCNPRALNLMLIFQDKYPVSQAFRDRFSGVNTENLRVFYVFSESGRNIPVEFTRRYEAGGADITYVSDFRNVDAFQVQSIDQVVRLAILQEQDFSVSIEASGRSWESGVYDMAGARQKWDAANLGRIGPARSTSSLCNEYAVK